MTGNYQKQPLGVKSKKYTAKYNRFAFNEEYNQDGVLVADEQTSCDLTSGTLAHGAGLLAYKFPSGREVFYSSSQPMPENIYPVYVNGKVSSIGYFAKGVSYIYDFQLKGFWQGPNLGGAMKTFLAPDEKGILRLCFCGAGGCWWYNGGYKQTSKLTFSAIACAFEGRIFTAAGNTVYYSSPFSLGDFTADLHNAGSIAVPGDTGNVVDVVAAKDGVYVFCDFGIWKLRTAPDARDFNLTQVAYSGRKIVFSSAQRCVDSRGEKFFFLALDGFYVLRGFTVKRIVKNGFFIVSSDTQTCRHAAYQNKVFYSFLDRHNARTGLTIDVEEETAYTSFTYYGLSEVEGEALCCDGDRFWRFRLNEALPNQRTCVFLVSKADFGVSGRKFLKSIRLLGNGTVTLKITGETEQVIKTLSMRRGKAEATFNLRGEFFRLHIKLEAGTIVRGLEADLETLAK